MIIIILFNFYYPPRRPGWCSPPVPDSEVRVLDFQEVAAYPILRDPLEKTVVLTWYR